MSDIIFEIEHLKKYFGPVKAVDDVSFQVRRGETVGIVGESGCGKTTLGRTILKLLEPTDGKIFITTSLTEGESPRRYDISAEERLRDLRRKMQIVYNPGFDSSACRAPAPLLRWGRDGERRMHQSFPGA